MGPYCVNSCVFTVPGSIIYIPCLIFKLATYSIKRLFCMFCLCSHGDPVCVARDESSQEGPDTSAGRRPHTQVLAPLQLCILLLFHSCVFRYSLTVFLVFRFIKGFICRHEEYCPDNDYFLDHVRCSFLKKLRQNLPKSVLDKSWPTPPPSLVEVRRKARITDLKSVKDTRVTLQASEHLRNLHMRNMVIKYCSRVQPEWKKQVS